MNIKLIAFDMDGVIVNVKSSWALIHEHFKVSSAKNMVEYLSGRITYSEFMRRDIKLWLSVKSRICYSELNNIFKGVKVSNEVKNVVRHLKDAGFEVAIVTSGVNILADRVCRILNIDYCLSNRLLFDSSGYLLPYGQAIVPLLDKDIVLYALARSLKLKIKDEVAYVGDSIFDIPVFKRVALPIAINADEKVSRHALTTLDAISCLVDVLTRYERIP